MKWLQMFYRLKILNEKEIMSKENKQIPAWQII